MKRPCLVVSARTLVSVRNILEYVLAAEIVVGANVVMLHHKETETEFQSPVKAVGNALVAEIVALAVVWDHPAA